MSPSVCNRDRRRQKASMIPICGSERQRLDAHMGGRVCANFAARPVFHHGAPCVAAANGARRSLPMASTACVSPSASLRLPLPHGCQDIFTDTRSACLSGFQGSIPLPAQTARGGSLKACPERSRTDPRRTWGWIASQRPFRTDAPLPFAIPKAPLHYALRLPPTCHDIFTHTRCRSGRQNDTLCCLWSLVDGKPLPVDRADGQCRRPE